MSRIFQCLPCIYRYAETVIMASGTQVRSGGQGQGTFFKQEQMMTRSVVKWTSLAAAAACMMALAAPAQAQDTKMVLGMSG